MTRTINFGVRHDILENTSVLILQLVLVKPKSISPFPISSAWKLLRAFPYPVSVQKFPENLQNLMSLAIFTSANVDPGTCSKAQHPQHCYRCGHHGMGSTKAAQAPALHPLPIARHKRRKICLFVCGSF